MKKIAFVTLKTFSGVGGIEQFNKYVAKCLQELGANGKYKKKVFSIYDDSPDAAIIEAKNFKGYKQRKVFAVLDIIRQVRGFDIVILGHVLLYPVGDILNFISKKTKWYFFAHGIEVWNKIPERQKKALQRCNGVLSVSRFTADALIANQGVMKDKIEIFYNSLDSKRLQNANDNLVQNLKIKYNLCEEDTVFLTVSRMSEKERDKGYPSAIKAMAELVREHKNVKHILIGTSTPEELVYINRLVAEHKLEGHVILAGYVSDEDLPNYYALADVFVMPSRKEGFGIVFIEAAWYGLQVIAGNKDGSKEAILYGEMGILVNADVQEEVNAAMKAQLGYRKTDSIIARNRHLINDNFSYKKMLERLENFIEKNTN